MYLEKIPKENGIDKLIIDIKDIGHYIDMGLTSCLFLELGSEGWLNAFKEYYSQTTRENLEDCNIFEKKGYGLAVLVPKENSRVEFLADNGHYALKFILNSEDEESREIIYRFLEKIMN
ncbi:MAG: hypothetical protein Q8P15_02045 [Nanoarchaeota archaeon]|nr:hypothetical protein [Nanoarchaeota archaeon]